MTLGEIVDFATETTGDISSDAQDFCRRAIRLKYATLYDAHNWRESLRVKDGIPLDPNLHGSLFLPWDAEEIIFCSLSTDGLNYIRLTYRERDWIERFYTPQLTLPGNTPWYFRAENLAWPAINPGVFTFTTKDKSPINVYIQGTDINDQPISESFILQAITNPDNSVTPVAISTANSYKLVYVISKSVTDTPLMVQANYPGVPLMIPPAMTSMVFTQIQLYPEPVWQGSDGTQLNFTVRVQVKLKPDSLDDDMSVPRISHIWEALLSFGTAALWKRMQQVAKAQADNQDAMAHVQAAINVEKNQSEFRQQVVPIRYESGDYVDDYTWARATSYNPFGY